MGNTSRILVNHGHVEHWMNGMKIVEYELNSPDFKAHVAGTKFAGWPLFASSPTGHIALSDYNCSGHFHEDDYLPDCRLSGVYGTPGYMAPEMLETNARYGREVDIWSLGLTMLELFAPTKGVSCVILNAGPELTASLYSHFSTRLRAMTYAPPTLGQCPSISQSG